MIQDDPSFIIQVFAAMSLGGLLFLILSVATLVPALMWHRRRMRRHAEAAGRVITFRSFGPSMGTIWGLEGLAYFLLFLAVGVAAAFGITFPIQLAQSLEAQLTAFITVFLGLFLGILTPGLLIYAVYLDIRAQREDLEAALRGDTTH